jgi:hypothetical protein
MDPTVRVGDRLKVVAVKRPRIGDVVLFESRDGRDLILHRVLAIVPGLPWFFHDGDGRTYGEPGIAHVRQLVGRALLPRRLPNRVDAAGIARRIARALARRLGR